MEAVTVIVIATIAWAALVIFFWKAGAWLPYYVLGLSLIHI